LKFRYYNAERNQLNIEGMIQDIEAAPESKKKKTITNMNELKKQT